MPRPPNSSPQTLSVLEVLLASPRTWHHGYALSRHAALKSGTLYPILARLAEQGWLEAKWTDPEGGRPPRHVYRLTGDGAKAARLRLADASANRSLSRLSLAPAGRSRS